MYKLVVTELAADDLDGIVRYITIKLANPAAATVFLDKVEKCYQILKETPFIYAECLARRLQSKNYRKVTIGNFLLVYRVDTEADRVVILRFFYGGRNYIRYL
jgi:plasmid stabilization system protein ParE